MEKLLDNYTKLIMACLCPWRFWALLMHVRQTIADISNINWPHGEFVAKAETLKSIRSASEELTTAGPKLKLCQPEDRQIA